ncbi:nucleotide-diphospho-sugar transferase, partial [Polychytrium aggregatum]|uniref:nucleotide-diphospho-sugar transferase n=1 Tax=Polychytrium aggregatum TaxID=110093 RepID=UPI0022FDD7B4
SKVDLNARPECYCSTQLHPLRIPKIIHQSWKNSTLPKRFERWANTWKQHHPTWTYILWTDEMNRRLVELNFPWFLDTYDSFPNNIERADSVRYLYMYKYGGVYADLDMECLRAMDAPYDKGKLSLVDRGPALLSFLGKDMDFKHSIPNAWMASAPGHPFWMVVINEIMKGRKRGVWVAEEATGPIMLRTAWMIYSNYTSGETEQLVTLASEYIFPYNWSNSTDLIEICSAQRSTINENECKRLLRAQGRPGQKPYAITYWSHSWEDHEINRDVLDEKGK